MTHLLISITRGIYSFLILWEADNRITITEQSIPSISKTFRIKRNGSNIPILQQPARRSALRRPESSPTATPCILDDSTGVVIADSFLVAEYLDPACPEAPRLFPPSAKASQTAFITAFLQTLRSVVPFVSPNTPRVLNPASPAYHAEMRFGSRKVEVPEGEERHKQWAKVKEVFGVLDSWMQKEGLFIMGRNASFADIVIANHLIWIKTALGEDSSEWYEINGWFVRR